MYRTIISFVFAVAVLAVGSSQVMAQADQLLGKWEGKLQSPQGERDTSATFKKEGEVITGSMPGMRPGSENKLTDIKVDGKNVTAKANIETPNGALTIHYKFTLEGDSLNGQGELDFNGQPFTFDIKLKRAAGAGSASAPATPAAQATQQTQATAPAARQGRTNVPQPQQKQSIDYFVGDWSYQYLGRESALGLAPRDCTVKFTKRSDGKSVEGVTECKADGAPTKMTTLIVFDEATKTLTMTEKYPGGITVTSKGDWTSPIAIRFTVEPIKAQKQALQLKRNYAIVAAHSFTIAEELSEDGGPFIRLGNAVVSKVTP